VQTQPDARMQSQSLEEGRIGLLVRLLDDVIEVTDRLMGMNDQGE
jgi:hypothetical protein